MSRKRDKSDGGSSAEFTLSEVERVARWQKDGGEAASTKHRARHGGQAVERAIHLSKEPISPDRVYLERMPVLESTAARLPTMTRTVAPAAESQITGSGNRAKRVTPSAMNHPPPETR